MEVKQRRSCLNIHVQREGKIFLLNERNVESQVPYPSPNDLPDDLDTDLKAIKLFRTIEKTEEALKPSPKLTKKDRVIMNYAIEHGKYFEALKLELSPNRKAMLKTALEGYQAHKKRYETVAKATGIPTELIAAIHYQESNMNFNTYLHNGQELGNKTTLVPKGILFDKGDWENAAIHALGGYRDGSEKDSNNGVPPNPKFAHLRELLDLAKKGDQMAFAEMYNGPGYQQISEKEGKIFRSPYVYAGSNYETTGRFVADRKFDPEAKSTRIGVAVLIKGMMEMNKVEA